MWIFVKSSATGDERKRIDNVHPTDKVEDLKILLAKAVGMEVRRMRVFHKGKPLENGHTLFEYNVKQDETVQVFPRAATPTPESALIPVANASKTGRRLETSAENDYESDDDVDIIPGKTQVPEAYAQPRSLSNIVAAPEPAALTDAEMQELQDLAELCDVCIKRPSRKCKTCGCSICGGKGEPEKQVICDECQMYFHIHCLKPPLKEIPEDDHWFCPGCKHDDSCIIKVGQKLDLSNSKKAKAPSATQTKKWGGGQACVGRTKVCTIVGIHHFGPIPGVEVGQTWRYRMQCSESGVHRPPVGGISGTTKVGSQSIVLSGGFPEDTDNGDWFLYSGSGGKDLATGNKRTSAMSFDQSLTKMNFALATTCDAPVSDKREVKARDWRKSKPIRVVRTDRLAKVHPKYAPAEGCRYDGIYKLVRYWPEKNSEGYKVYRYEFRRDDPSPAPWTPDGKKRIEELGLEMIYPDNYDFSAEKEKKTNSKILKRNQRKGKDGIAAVEVEDDWIMEVVEEETTKTRTTKLINKHGMSSSFAVVIERAFKKKSAPVNLATANTTITKAPMKRSASELKDELGTTAMCITKKLKKPWIVPQELQALIDADTTNARLWKSVLNPLTGEQLHNITDYMQSLATELSCPVCLMFVQQPITTVCGHNVCSKCLTHSVDIYGCKCPSCRTILVTDTEQVKSLIEQAQAEQNMDKKAKIEEKIEKLRREIWTRENKENGGGVNMRLVECIRWNMPTYGLDE